VADPTQALAALTCAQVAVTAAVAQAATFPHVDVVKKRAVVSQATFVAAPHEHVEHVAGSATSPDPPWTTSVEPAGHAAGGTVPS
jgi:hypothetical protein